MKKALLFILLAFISILVNSQNTLNKSSLRGIVQDVNNKESIPFANIALYQDTLLISGTQSDIDGKYSFNNLAAGSYKIVVQNIGYQKLEIDHIVLHQNKITSLNLVMKTAAIQLELFEVVQYNAPLISKDVALSSYSISSKRRRFRQGSNRALGISPERRESYAFIKDNQYQMVNKNPLSTFSIDVDRASYSNIRRHLNEGNLPPKDAVRIEEMINYFSYNYPQPIGEHPFSINTEYTNCPWNSNHKLVHIGIQGKKVEMSDAKANNLVFLIDVSGSMNASNKLDLLKKGLYLLVDNLRSKDKVSIVVYAGAAGVVLAPTSGKNKDKIKDAISNLNAGGSTAGGAGIELAYKLAKEHFIKNGNNRILLATDGDFNVGVSNENELERLIVEKRNDNIFLSVLGFGTGNLQDSKMEILADKGNGNYNYIDNILEAKKVLVTELGGTLITIAKDVKIQAEFNPEHVKAYRLIGYVNRQLEDADFNDDKKDAGELGSGHTVTALYEIIPPGSVENINNIDDLKYQKVEQIEEGGELNNEVMTIKFRYKNPKAAKSILITNVLYDEQTSFQNCSDNLRFAASVASFGMLLRNSEFKGEGSLEKVIDIAQRAKGIDEEGYRAEFIRLVEITQLLELESLSR